MRTRYSASPAAVGSAESCTARPMGVARQRGLSSPGSARKDSSSRVRSEPSAAVVAAFTTARGA